MLLVLYVRSHHQTLKRMFKKHNPTSSGKRGEEEKSNYNKILEAGKQSRPKKSGEGQIQADPRCRILKRLGNWRHQLPLEVGVKHSAKIKRPADCFSIPHPQRPVTAPPSTQKKIHIHPHSTKLSARASDVLNLDLIPG